MNDVNNLLLEERVLVLAPTAADAALCRSLLADAGLGCQVCADLCGLCQAYEGGAGTLLLTEEVLGDSDSHCLVDLLNQQPVWSDVPILLLTSQGADSPLVVEAMERLGNVTLLERPVRLNTLVSALWAALRARRRQYELRKRLEERRANEQALKDADRRKDEFLAMLAHELRNPLAPIRTGLDLMRLRVTPDSPLHPVLDMAERQLGQMTRLVDDLLDVSRITRGKITLHKERMDLHAVITQAVETARPLIDARQHDLTYTPAPEPLFLDADPTRLAQALSNVLGNAAKYTEKSGRIRLAVERDNGEAVVRVRDNGIGIVPKVLPTVFELFTQAQQAQDHSPSGLGIGLAVAKQLAEMHGGSVTAHSAGQGQGSEFIFRLPLLKESGSAETAVRGGPEAPGRTEDRLRVLLVDDLADVAEGMAALVREAFGHKVHTAHDGPSALQAATAFRPELVLLDIGLPGMSGYEVARRLRELPGLGDAVLVALTGWGQEEDRRKTQEAGFDHHLVKPVGLRELQRLLADLK